jgi:PAP2 superfamily protein
VASVWLALGIFALALVVGGVRCALVVAAVIALANLTTVLLAATLSVQRSSLSDPAAWPSNHTTAVGVAGLSLLLIARGRLRPPAALIAAGMGVGIGLMLLIRGTHLLSDIVAALLVAGFWVAVGAQVLDAHRSS